MNRGAELTTGSVAAVLITVAVSAILGRIIGIDRVWEPDYARPDPEPTIGAELGPLAGTTPLEVLALQARAREVFARETPFDTRLPWPKSRPEPTPTFGSNDRSRWATIRALVDHGTYVVGTRETDPVTGAHRDTGLIFENGWQSVDKVLKPDVIDGKQYFYSSKPPFLSTILAGGYWVLRHTGLSLPENKGFVVRIMLVVFNVAPLLVYLILLERLTGRFMGSAWGRVFVIASACAGTFMTTFATTLNNHLISGCTALFAVAPLLPAGPGDDRGPGTFRLTPAALAVSGFFAAFTACTELPATAFAVGLFGLLLLTDARRAVLYFLPAALVPTGFFFLTNYLAIGRWTVAYGEFGGPWYEYEGSIWASAPGQVKHGIDWAYQSESRWMYAFHFFVGHHGVFSLTPLWLLVPVGIGVQYPAFRRWLGGLVAVPGGETETRPANDPGREPALALITWLTAVVSVVVVWFYLALPRWNYGGVTSGPRWLIWLTPLWLLCLMPVVDRLSHTRRGRAVLLVLLAGSVLSVMAPAWNPWRHPWLYKLLEDRHWIQY